MNALQKNIIILAVVFILLFGLFPRYYGVRIQESSPFMFDIGHKFILSAPSPSEILSIYNNKQESYLPHHVRTVYSVLNLQDFVVKITTVATTAFGLVVVFKD